MRSFAIAGLIGLLVATPALARDYFNPEVAKDYYKSSDGTKVHRPTREASTAYGPIAASCRDGTFSYSHHAQGTCSGHRGVAQWYTPPR